MERAITWLTRALPTLVAACLCCLLCACGPTVMQDAPDAAHPGNLEFRSDARLQDHFEKHGDEVGCATAEEYLARANAVVADPAARHKTQREDGDDVYFLDRTGEFVVVSSERLIRTYFITDADYFNNQ